MYYCSTVRRQVLQAMLTCSLLSSSLRHRISSCPWRFGGNFSFAACGTNSPSDGLYQLRACRDHVRPNVIWVTSTLPANRHANAVVAKVAIARLLPADEVVTIALSTAEPTRKAILARVLKPTSSTQTTGMRAGAPHKYRTALAADHRWTSLADRPTCLWAGRARSRPLHSTNRNPLYRSLRFFPCRTVQAMTILVQEPRRRCHGRVCRQIPAHFLLAASHLHGLLHPFRGPCQHHLDLSLLHPPTVSRVLLTARSTTSSRPRQLTMDMQMPTRRRHRLRCETT